MTRQALIDDLTRKAEKIAARVFFALTTKGPATEAELRQGEPIWRWQTAIEILLAHGLIERSRRADGLWLTARLPLAA